MQPKLRFKEFKLDWNKSVLGNLCLCFQSGKGITSQNIYKVGKYAVYGGNGLRGYTDSFTHEGEFALVGRQGALCGNVNLVDGQNYISEHAIAIQSNVENDTKWISYLLTKMELRNLSESSAQPGLAVNKLVRIKMFFPKKAEQVKIATFLSAVDQKITILEKQQQAWEQYKQGMMQKLFSGELRFKDDNGEDFPEWENTVLNDFLTESFVKGSSGKYAKKLTVKLWGKGVVPKETAYQGSENTQYYKRSKGQLIYGKLDFLNCAFGIIPNDLDGFESTIDAPAFDISLDKAVPIYILNKIMQNSFYKKNGEEADGSRKAKRINQKVFLNMNIELPCLKEQYKITDFLTTLDKKIDNISHQLTQMKTWKQGLLQQMFI